MGGSVHMVEESLKLAYGENSELIKDKRIAAVQALSGTGACRLFAAFQQRFHPNTQIYIPVPTWAKLAFHSNLPLNVAIYFLSLQSLIFSYKFLYLLNIAWNYFSYNVINYSHHNIWRDAGVPIKTFRYYHPESKGLDFSGLMDDIKVHCSDS
jgi:aspartate aminotransferase